MGSLLLMVRVSVATVSNWRELPPSFANNMLLNAIERVIFFHLKMPIEAEVNQKRMKHNCKSHLRAGTTQCVMAVQLCRKPKHCVAAQ